MKEGPNNYPVREIFSAVTKHPAGDFLKETERWSVFRDDESTKVWREVLGATANTLEHSELFTGVVRIFIKEEGDKYTPQEQRSLVLGTAVHDFGEAMISGDGVGDIAWYKKTKETEKKESEIAHIVIDDLEIEGDLKEELHTAYRKVVEGENEKLHLAFKALEKTEYFMTGMKVYQTSRKREQKGEPLLKNEKSMVGRIIVNDLQNILGTYMTHFPNSIGKYVENMIPVVDEAYAFTKPQLKKEKGYGERMEKFEKSWAEFKKNPPSRK